MSHIHQVGIDQVAESGKQDKCYPAIVKSNLVICRENVDTFIIFKLVWLGGTITFKLIIVSSIIR